VRAADKLWLGAGRSILGSHEVSIESTASGSSARRQASIMKWHSAPELLPLTNFPAEPISARAFHPTAWKIMPVRAGQFPDRRIGLTEGPPVPAQDAVRCRSRPSSFRQCTPMSAGSWCRHAAMKIKTARPPLGDQASDLDLLGSGVGFEPTTSGSWAESDTVQPSPALRGTE
jgi:hypothetical protein